MPCDVAESFKNIIYLQSNVQFEKLFLYYISTKIFLLRGAFKLCVCSFKLFLYCHIYVLKFCYTSTSQFLNCFQRQLLK